MRLVPSIALAALIVGCSNAPAGTGKPSFRETVLSGGMARIEVLGPGTLRLCKTERSMQVESSTSEVKVTGGHMCVSNQPPTIVIDPSTCDTTGSPDLESVILSCTPTPARAGA